MATTVTLERPRGAHPQPQPQPPPQPPRQSTRPEAPHPSRSKSTSAATGAGAGAGGRRRQQQQQTAPGYVDVIDKLDLSGMEMSFHHSGPFDAARAKGKGRSDQHAPIAAFSSLALDPTKTAVAANGADLAPLRPSANSNNNNHGRGLSARAKATLAAMDGNEYAADGGAAGDESSENLLSSAERRDSRRNSDSSITLGFPVHNANGEVISEKERQYMEAFGVHTEAYEDFGRSSYARRAPRASVYPADDSPRRSNLGSSGLSKESRADRTASIWDIEATLRAGRPVGASSGVPPPMPIIPQHLLDTPPPVPALPPMDAELSGSLQPGGSIKRSKSLLSRMRSKKDKSLPSSPDPSAAASPLKGHASPSLDTSSPFFTSPDRSGAQSKHSSPQTDLSSFSTRPLRDQPSSSLSSSSSSSTSKKGRGLAVELPDKQAAFSPGSSRNGKAPLPSPLGLPEPVRHDPGSKYFPQYGDGAGEGNVFDDAYYESTTAAILADSSSKESNLSSTGSYGDGGHDEGNRSRGGASSKTMTPDTSFASSTTTNRTYVSDENVSPTVSRHQHPLPPIATEGSRKDPKLNRKPSFAKRLLGGRSKKRV